MTATAQNLLCCPYCGKVCGSVQGYGRHLKAIHPERNGDDKICTFRFKPKDMLSLVGEIGTALEGALGANVPDELQDRIARAEAKQRLMVLFQAVSLLKDMTPLIEHRRVVQDELVRRLNGETLTRIPMPMLLDCMGAIDETIRKNLKFVCDLLGVRRGKTDDLVQSLQGLVEELQAKTIASEVEALPVEAKRREALRAAARVALNDVTKDEKIDVDV